MSIHRDPTVNVNGGATKHVTEVVHSMEEGNALAARLKQLESENSSLAHTLSKVCDENASMAGQLAELQVHVTEIAAAPLKASPVLRSLFEPEKTGWFGGSKAAAREQLEKLAEALQKEYLSYQASHASSNDEVQALLAGLHTAHENAAGLSKVIDEQQQLLSTGPLAVTVRVVSVGDSSKDGDRSVVAELKRDRDHLQDRIVEMSGELQSVSGELHDRTREIARLKAELRDMREGANIKGGSGAVAAAAGAATVSSASAALRLEVEAQKAKDDNTRLRAELQQLREALAAEERLHAIKRKESEDLTKKVDELTRARAADADKMKADAKKRTSNAAGEQNSACTRCESLRSELEEMKRTSKEAEAEVKATKARLLETTTVMEKNNAALQSRLLECQTELTQKQSLIARSVLSEELNKVDLERKSLAHELSLSHERVAHLEALVEGQNRSSVTALNLSFDKNQQESLKEAGVMLDSKGSEDALNVAQVLETLERNKERIARNEFEAGQMRLQLEQATQFAVARDEEARRLERASVEDRQRIAFLLKKCAASTAEHREAAAGRDSGLEEVKTHQLTIKKLQRQLDEVPQLRERCESLTAEKQRLEERVAGTTAIEERLVKAKETIAYMELAQSRAINMSQYAELQAERDKLENTMEPLRRKLEEANKEIERLHSVTEAQQTVSATQKSSVQGWQDKVEELSASEATVKEKVAMLTSDNERLHMLNASLEAQMTDMQDGIKEMAMKMDRERTGARATAEASTQREMEQLREQLQQAQATLSNVAAKDGEFVAGGLYQSTVEERERLQEELTRKNFETEKLKSEILIYRQTIVDLEAENDEHVKDIEGLQDRYQAERTSLSERLAAEQQRTQDLTNTIESMKESVEKDGATVEQHAATIVLMEKRCAKLQSTLDATMQHEETLASELTENKRQLAVLKEQLQQEKQKKAEIAAATSSLQLDKAKELKSLSVAGASGEEAQMQVRQLKEELERSKQTAVFTAEEDKKLLAVHRAQLAEGLPEGGRKSLEAEVNRNQALRVSNEALVREIEVLRRQLCSTATAADGKVQPQDASKQQQATLYNKKGAPSREVQEVQQHLIAQRETFTLAMEQAVADVAAQQTRVHELEQQLAAQKRELEEARKAPKTAVMAAVVPVDVHSGAEDLGEASTQLKSDMPASSPLGNPVVVRKRVKKVKRGKSLAEQVGTSASDVDVLNVTANTSAMGALPVGDAGVPPFAPVESDHDAAATKAKHQLSRAQLELETLRRENVALKQTIGELTAELQACREELSSAVAQLEAAGSGAGSAKPLSDAAAASVLMKENAVLQRQLSELQQRPASMSVVSPSAAVGMEVKALTRQVKEQEAEIKALSSQLMPTKNKLVEYMALADRLGIQYPFPPDLEGTAVMRLSALTSNRAVSAPHPPKEARHAVDMVSPPPRQPDRTRNRRGDFASDEDVSLL